jgi:hypothetical protein
VRIEHIAEERRELVRQLAGALVEQIEQDVDVALALGNKIPMGSERTTMIRERSTSFWDPFCWLAAVAAHRRQHQPP